VKLLIYSHFFTPSVGGVETIVLSLARGLAEFRAAANENPFDVTLVTQIPAGDFDDRTLPFRVIRRPSLIEMWRLVRQSDVIHVAGPSLAPLFLAWVGGKPFVVEHHGYQAICPNGVLVHKPDGAVCPGHFQAGRYAKCLKCQAVERSWLRSFANLLLMFPRHLLTCAAAHNIAITRHVLERHALPRSSVVYYGIEDASANPISAASLPGGSGKICFAYVGRLVPEKGLLVLLEAAQIVRREGREFELLLIGDGPQREKLEGIIERTQLGDTVRITGFLQGAAFAETLGRVHVVIMPSVWEETAGLAAIEQMMRGRLVIASEIGGLGEVVGQAGLTCLPGNAEDLARCMREVLTDPSKIVTIGCSARERARQVFLRDRMLAEHAQLYSGLSTVPQ
jgi:glycogen synthase